jgi:uncharacterized protein YbaA (DUF1428 family)
MRYVDGFVIPLPKKGLPVYRTMARKAAKVWKEHGALEYMECVGDDLETGMGTSFPRLLKLKRGETVVFSWIVYRSRAHRDRVNAKVMSDPRIAAMMKDAKAMPFDMARMNYAGFKVLVEA